MDHEQLEQLAKDCKYDATEIGVTILRELGYKVEFYWGEERTEIYVTDKNGNMK